MPKYAVGFISFFDNELTIEIVEAGDEMLAVSKHSKAKDYEVGDAVDLEDVKAAFFDSDAAIDVVEIK